MVTLVLGVGANATVFSFLDRVYLQAPPGVQGADRVQRIYAASVRARGTTPGAVSLSPYFGVPDLEDLGTAARGLADIEGYSGVEVRAVGPDGDSAGVTYVSERFLPMLGVRAVLGRFFAAEESHFGDPRPVAVLSYGYWKRHYASDPAVIGKTTLIDSTVYTIVGVAQEGFQGIDMDGVDIWAPLAARAGGNEAGYHWYEALGSGVVMLVARLHRGTAANALGARLTMQFRRTNSGQGWFDPRSTVLTAPLPEAQGPLGLSEVDEAGVSLAVRLAAVSLAAVFVAAANVASLLLMRALNRRREVAVRLALGAPRRRLLGQLLVETVLLGVVTAAAALVVTSFLGAILRTALLSHTRWAATVVTQHVVIGTSALALAAAAAASFAPATIVMRGDIGAALKTGAFEGGAPGSRLRLGLLVGQAAICMALLAAAAIFAESLQRAGAFDRGFDPDRLVTVGAYGSLVSKTEMDAAIERVRRVPGVRSAAAAGFDLRSSGTRVAVWTPAGDSLNGARSPAGNFVDPTYLQVAGFRLVSGRGLASQEYSATHPVAVVTEAFARALWSRGAVGNCFFDGPGRPCRFVLGVISDLRWDIGKPPSPLFFAPLSQGPKQLHPRDLLVRTEESVTPQMAAAIYGALRPILGRGGDPVLVRRVSDRLDPQTRPIRIAGTLFLLFGVLALLSAAVGTYGLVTFDLNSHARELAVHMALGATTGRIMLRIIRGGVRAVVIGLAIGTAMALAVGRLVASLLFRTSPNDPLAVAAAAITLVLAALLAGVLAVRRAVRLDPMTLLNSE